MLASSNLVASSCDLVQAKTFSLKTSLSDLTKTSSDLTKTSSNLTKASSDLVISSSSGSELSTVDKAYYFLRPLLKSFDTYSGFVKIFSFSVLGIISMIVLFSATPLR